MRERREQEQGMVRNWGASNFPLESSDLDASQEESLIAEAARTRLPIEVVAPKRNKSA